MNMSETQFKVATVVATILSLGVIASIATGVLLSLPGWMGVLLLLTLVPATVFAMGGVVTLAYYARMDMCSPFIPSPSRRHPADTARLNSDISDALLIAALPRH